MKKIIFALICTLCCSVVLAQSNPIQTARQAQSSAKPTTELTEFTITAYLLTETVTCKQFFYGVDIGQYGSVTGSGCTKTGAIPAYLYGTFGGHVNGSFTFLDGSTVTLSTCEQSQNVAMPGYYHFSILCL